jgi:hypothetical protein
LFSCDIIFAVDGFDGGTHIGGTIVRVATTGIIITGGTIICINIAGEFFLCFDLMDNTMVGGTFFDETTYD